MRGARFFVSCVAVLTVFLFVVSAIAQQPPTPQTAGGLTQQEKELQQRKKLEKQIETKKEQPAQIAPEAEIPAATGPKVRINRIVVEGVSLLSEADIQGITAPYQGKDLNIRELQKVADLITDAYRKKGYVTSRAYLPPQTVKEGTLMVRVVEGKLGSVSIRGNKYFKTAVLEKKLNVRPSGYFDYSALQRSLVYINEHPDRTARATLVPGKAPGTTDIVIDVEDRLPIHAGFEFDNYGSRYIGKERYAFILEHNNLIGFDDKFYAKIQFAEDNQMLLEQIRYSFPIAAGFELGGYALYNKTKLGKEFKDLDARGKARLYGLFANKSLINTPDTDLRLFAGFDYKSIKNYLLGIQNSRDEVRIIKGGLDLDLADIWGRNIITGELDIGVPDVFGGMPEKSLNASRAGAAGQFTKWLFNYYRLQPMPWETAILWKNSAQLSNNYLVASEEFQIGGPSSVRGYPPAEFGGDSGYYTALEWSVPFYFLSKEWRVPFNEEKLYDTMRFVAFYDLATAELRRTAVGERKKDTLRGYGCGVRFNLRDNISLRIEVGWPSGQKSSDGDSAHPWVELVTRF